MALLSPLTLATYSLWPPNERCSHMEEVPVLSVGLVNPDCKIRLSYSKARTNLKVLAYHIKKSMVNRVYCKTHKFTASHTLPKRYSRVCGYARVPHFATIGFRPFGHRFPHMNVPLEETVDPLRGYISNSHSSRYKKTSDLTAYDGG